MCSSQTAVNLNIFHKLGTSEFAYYLPSQNNTPDGNFKLSRMEYYLTNFRIIHDGGQITTIPDSVIALVKAGPSTAIYLGNHTLNTIEGVKFYVGVPKNYNHLDPALQPNGSPLAYQAPSMHWGWIAGYQFVALEGLTSPAMNQLTELHSFGDDNYTETTVLSEGSLYNGAFEININADYNRALENIDISTGLIVHGDFLQANEVLFNFNHYVFSSSNSLAGVEEFNPVDVSIYPIPANGKFTIQTPQNFNADVLKLYTTNGQLLKEIRLKNGQNSINVEIEYTGIIVLEFYKNGTKLFSEKVMNN
ncbi:MAG: MbnP family protein [Crocinitomicaceae bacterium]